MCSFLYTETWLEPPSGQFTLLEPKIQIYLEIYVQVIIFGAENMQIHRLQTRQLEAFCTNLVKFNSAAGTSFLLPSSSVMHDTNHRCSGDEAVHHLATRGETRVGSVQPPGVAGGWTLISLNHWERRAPWLWRQSLWRGWSPTVTGAAHCS